MKPLNYADKKSAVNRFVGIFTLCLLAVFGSGYVFFSSPNMILKDELKDNQLFRVEHDSLLEKTSKVTSQIQNLRAAENKYNDKNSLNPQEEDNVSQYLTNIQSSLNSLRQDTDRIIATGVKKDLSNYIVSLDAIYLYGVMGQQLRKSNESYKMTLANKGDNSAILMAQNQKTENENRDLKQKLQDLQNSAKNVLPVNPGGGASAELTKLREDVVRLQTERDVFKNDKAMLTDEVNKLKETQSQSKTQANPVQVCTEADKSKLLFQTADVLYVKGQSEKKDIRKGYLSAALDILRGTVMQSYPEKSKLNDRITEITKALNPVGNN